MDAGTEAVAEAGADVYADASLEAVVSVYSETGEYVEVDADANVDVYAEMEVEAEMIRRASHQWLHISDPCTQGACNIHVRTPPPVPVTSLLECSALILPALFVPPLRIQYYPHDPLCLLTYFLSSPSCPTNYWCRFCVDIVVNNHGRIEQSFHCRLRDKEFWEILDMRKMVNVSVNSYLCGGGLSAHQLLGSDTKRRE